MEPFETFAVQLLAMIRVRYPDQLLSPFRDRLAVQVSNAVLGNNVVCMSARGYDARTLLQIGDDLGPSL